MPHELNPLAEKITPSTKRRSKRESARIAYQDIRRREQRKTERVEEKQTVERPHVEPSIEALERTRQNRCQHGVLKLFTDCSSPKIEIQSTSPQINATHIAAGLTAITSTLAPLIVQPFNESGKLLNGGMDEMAYNTTLPALSTSTEQSNNTIFTDYSDVSLPARLLLMGAAIIIGSSIVPIILYAKGYYSRQKENNEDSENNYSRVESVDNLNEAEKGLLSVESPTPKAEVKKPQVNFALVERTTGNNKNRHQFYKSLPSNHSSFDTQGMDYDTPRHSNS